MKNYTLSKLEIVQQLSTWASGNPQFKDPAMHILSEFYNTKDKPFLHGVYDVFAGEVDLSKPYALVRNKNYFGALTAFNALCNGHRGAILGFVTAHFPDSIKMKVFPEIENLK